MSSPADPSPPPAASLLGWLSSVNLLRDLSHLAARRGRGSFLLKAEEQQQSRRGKPQADGGEEVRQACLSVKYFLLVFKDVV